MDDSVKNIDNAITSAATPNIAVSSVANSQANEANVATNVAVEPEQKKHRSVGNKIYDFGVFGSVAFAGVSAMSAITGYEASYGKNKYFDWMRTANTKIQSGLSDFLSKTVMKKSPAENVNGMAKNITMVFTLGMGAHILMPLIKWMEDNRQKNATKIDKVLGTTPPDKGAVENEVKQSWKSVFVGRMTSWGAAFAAVIAIGPKLMEKMTNFFGEKGENVWMKLKPQSNKKTVRQWSNLIVFDVIGTAVTAGVMFISSRIFAKRDAKKHGDGDVLYETNITAPNPFGDEDPPQKSNSNFAQKVKSENRVANIAAADPNLAFADKIKNESSTGRVLT